MIHASGIAELRRILADVRAGGARIGFVPTMGALHEGHLTLCDEALRHADFVVMSVFVNPLQFGPGEDLDRYPRDLQRDAELAAGRGVSLLFAPERAAVYPAGEPQVRVVAPRLADRLCGRFRPGHFDGVLTVVAKLFNIVAPAVAVFGRKDLQQAILIRRMVADLDIPVQIVVAPLIRDPDGLAMSSRNAYLSPEERRSALRLHTSLQAAQAAFADGATDPADVIAAARRVLAADAAVAVEYVELVEVATLDTPTVARAGDAVAVAARIGSTRLIDNHVLA